MWGSGSMSRVFASGPRDMRMRNNPGNARVCPGLQAPMCMFIIELISSTDIVDIEFEFQIILRKCISRSVPTSQACLASLANWLSGLLDMFDATVLRWRKLSLAVLFLVTKQSNQILCQIFQLYGRTYYSSLTSNIWTFLLSRHFSPVPCTIETIIFLVIRTLNYLLGLS